MTDNSEFESEREIYRMKKFAVTACRLPEESAIYIRGETREEILIDARNVSRILGAHTRSEKLTPEEFRTLARERLQDRVSEQEEIEKKREEDLERETAEFTENRKSIIEKIMQNIIEKRSKENAEQQSEKSDVGGSDPRGPETGEGRS